jgi:hypothetical protein
MFVTVETLKIHSPTKTHLPDVVNDTRALQQDNTLVPFALFTSRSLLFPSAASLCPHYWYRG